MDMKATILTVSDSCELDIIEDPETLRAVIGLMELKTYVPTPLSTWNSETDERLTDDSSTPPGLQEEGSQAMMRGDFRGDAK